MKNIGIIDDFNYRGIKDREILFGEVDEQEYYKPILVKIAFKGSYKKCESRRDKDKKSSGK